MVNRTWRNEARCRGVDPELFMPLRKGLLPVDAMRTCVQCPVRLDCLQTALESNDPTADLGVWGGTTRRSRDRIRSGRLTVAEAMGHGDAIAARLTPAERQAA